MEQRYTDLLPELMAELKRESLICTQACYLSSVLEALRIV